MQAIYKILNKNNNKFYIGSTNNIKKRWNNHRCNLRNNRHENNYLQQAWNKYGEESFEFLILEEVNDENRIQREIHYLNETKCYERDIGYNFDKNPIDKSGKNNPFYGKKHSEEIKSVMKKNALNRTEEHKNNILKNISKGESHKDAKLNWEMVLNIREEYANELNTFRGLAKKFNVSKSTIQAIIENKTWVVQDLLG